MTSAERRAEIMRILTVRRSETASRLASELEVSPSTIYRDVLALTAEYPLETQRGNGGCVKVADWYHPHRSILSIEQQQVLRHLMDVCDDHQAYVLQQMLMEYGNPQYRQAWKTKELTNMGKILLTGGAGFIGAHTCVELLNAGYDIVVVDNYSNSTPEAMKRVARITGKTFPVYEADVCDRSAMEEIFRKEDISAAIHFAGYKAVGESVAKPVMYYRNNLDATLTLLEVMAAHGVKCLLFSSSATVYGTDAGAACREDMHLTFSTSNPYGSTKFIIERMLEDVVKADESWSVIRLRYFNPVGAHESGLIGEGPRDIPNNLMPYIARVAVGTLPYLNVFGDDYPTPDGTGVRDYIHVTDLAMGHMAALRYAAAHTGVEVFNLGTGAGYSVLDMVHAFSRACGKEIPYRIAPRRSGDIAACYADVSKAKEVLRWNAQLGIDDMCRSAWNWQRRNPNGYEK